VGLDVNSLIAKKKIYELLKKINDNELYVSRSSLKDIELKLDKSSARLEDIKNRKLDAEAYLAGMRSDNPFYVSINGVDNSKYWQKLNKLNEEEGARFKRFHDAYEQLLFEVKEKVVMKRISESRLEQTADDIIDAIENCDI